MPDAASSSFVEPPQPVYVAPSVLTKPTPSETPNPIATVAAPAPSAQEVVERPHPGTLARGRYEVTPTTILLTLAAATLLMLLYAFARARRAANRRQRDLDRLTALPGKREAST